MNKRAEEKPFWKTKSLSGMSREEWEALCDGCGRCCLEKLEDEDTGKVHYTAVACRMLDIQRCRCTAYGNRSHLAPDCITLTPENALEIPWLPRTCAYRLMAEGKKLEWWHPLVSGKSETVHEAGISVRGKAISWKHADSENLEAYILPSKMY